ARGIAAAQRSGGFRSAAGECDAKGNEIGKPNMAGAQPVGQFYDDFYMKTMAGPQIVDRAALVGDFAEHFQRRQPNSRPQSEQEPFPQKPDEQGKGKKSQGPALVEEPQRHEGEDCDQKPPAA